MRRIGRTALVANVWTTAVLTLVAGLPHFECRCPDGTVKPFGLGLLSRAAGCCCGKADSAPAVEEQASAAPARPTCPLCRHHNEPAASRDSGCHLGHPGCTKTFVQAVSMVSPSAKVVVGKDLTCHALCPATATALQTIAEPTAAHPVFWPDALSPPGDRLLVLERLNI
jgi:hypothetical protein